jgi:hypothetical protein
LLHAKLFCIPLHTLGIASIHAFQFLTLLVAAAPSLSGRPQSRSLPNPSPPSMHVARRSITPLKSHAGVRLMRCAHCASITTRELAARCACIDVVLSCLGDVGTFGSLTRVCSVFPSGCPRPLCMQVLPAVLPSLSFVSSQHLCQAPWVAHMQEAHGRKRSAASADLD